MRRVLIALGLAAQAGVASGASAQDTDPAAIAAAADADIGIEDGESEELRALRMAEFELFAHEQPLVEVTPTMPRLMRMSVPESLTSEVRAVYPRTESGAERPRDFSWLEGLNLPDIPVRWDARVVRYLEFFRDDARGQAMMRAWLRRIERFGPLIRRTLREHGLPEDLIYLAMVESGFDPNAQSAVGAVGMWQFVERTGDEYGLTRSRWVDLRRDPEASTLAGARYLADLHRRLGTWELAFAAYNMGYGGLLRSIRKYSTNDYWELSHLEAAVPFETAHYVAKITACAIVGRNPARFGMTGLDVEQAIEPDTVTLPGGTPLTTVARAAGTSPDEVRALNPALLRDRVPPGEEMRVRIPAGSRSSFEQRWVRMRPRHPITREYVVRFGEDIRTVARRHRLAESELRELNDLGADEAPRPGTVLIVPAVPVREVEPEAQPVIAVPRGGFTYRDRRRVFYRVQATDRLEEICSFFRVTLSELTQWNAIDPHATLHADMFLQLFVPPEVDLGRALVMSPDDVRILVVGSEEFYAWHLEQEGRVRIRYRVQEGDTLSQIAERFGLSVGSMARINQIGRESTLRIGQELIVYTTPDRVPSELRHQLASDAGRSSGSSG